jgi:apolipoprotein N-acyltransferase
MSETAAERAAVVQQVLADTATEPPNVKQAALEAVAAPIPPPTGTDIGWLWKALVVGLLILIGIAAVGVIWAVLDGKDGTDADKVLIIFTPLLTGLLGLFVPSPAAGGNTNTNP